MNRKPWEYDVSVRRHTDRPRVSFGIGLTWTQPCSKPQRGACCPQVLTLSAAPSRYHRRRAARSHPVNAGNVEARVRSADRPFVVSSVEGFAHEDEPAEGLDMMQPCAEAGLDHSV